MGSQLTENFESNITTNTNRKSNNVGFDTIRLRYTLKKSWPWILLIITISLTVSFFLNRYTKPVYISESVIKLEFDENAEQLGLSQAIGGRNQIAKNLSGEVEILKSNVLYSEVLNSLNLSITYYTKGKFLDDEKFTLDNPPFTVLFDSIESSTIYDRPVSINFLQKNKFLITLGGQSKEEFFGQEFTLEGHRLTIKKNITNSVEEQSVNYFIINSEKQLRNYLDKNISIKLLNIEAQTIGLYFKDENQLKANTINQFVIDNYRALSVKVKQKSNEQTLDFINKKLDSTQNYLEEVEEKMHTLSQGSIFGNTSEAYTLISAEKDKLKIEKSELNKKIELLNHLNNIVSQNQDLNSSIPELDGLSNSSLSTAINQLNQTNEEFKKLKESHKPSTLSYKNKEIERNSLRNTILRYIFENEKIILTNLAEVEDNITKLNNELLKLPSKETNMVRLKRNYNIAENFYIQLNQKKIEFETTKAGKVPDFIVLSTPSISTQLATARPTVIYLSALGIGLLFSSILFIIYFFYENKILNQKELSRLTPIPIIGAIPRFKKEKMLHSKLQVIDFPQSRISEAFRNIRSNLGFICNIEGPKIITISSTVSGEGKTFITLNTAGILALSNKKVIVIDLDMRKPKLHHGFDTTNKNGMSDILAETVDYKKCVQNSGFEMFDFITAGVTPPNPSELILKPRFKTFLEELKTEYDYVIIDTPPVGLVTDGITAMSMADAQIYVTRANYTSINMVKDIENIRSRKKFSNMSLVINDVSFTQKSYDHTGYGYGYGYYTED